MERIHCQPSIVKRRLQKKGEDKAMTKAITFFLYIFCHPLFPHYFLNISLVNALTKCQWGRWLLHNHL